MVLNDEAHHCYREKPGEDEEGALKGDDRKEAEKNTEAARLWISGLEAVTRKLGVNRVLDLSATPFFLRGSGYAEGTLFPWTMNDFSLMDAIECGIVKLPRVPVADNIPGDEMPKFRNLWENIRGAMPKKGRGKGASLDPLELPTLLKTALEALYGHYKKHYESMAAAGIEVPPCFIVVCNNTSTSKLVYDYIAGFHRENPDGSTTLQNGSLELFRNFNEHGNPAPVAAYAADRQRAIGVRRHPGQGLPQDGRGRDRAFPAGDHGAYRRSSEGGEHQRSGPSSGGDEHRRQTGTPGEFDSLRGVRVHADRRLGREHGEPRARRAGIRDAVALRTGRWAGVASPVIRSQ